MNAGEFDSTHWQAKMKCTYKGKERDIVSVTFDERLLGLSYEDNDDDLEWVRCENVFLN